MNCATCMLNKIGPEICPFGGYFCSNDHLQCSACNASSKGHCGVCHASTKFTQMNFNSPRSSVEPLTSARRPSVLSKHRPIASVFSKHQLVRNNKTSDANVSVNDVATTDIARCHTNCTETLFIAKTPVDNSASFIGNSVREDVENNLNVGESSDVENKKAALKHHPKELKDMKKENVFLFEEDPNDSYYIHTSKIRFMDSTDSFQNFYTTTVPGELSCTSRNDRQQQNCLSVKVLRDFETQNSANSTEVVKNYLESCSPTRFQHAPTYDCQHSHCDFGWQARNQKLEMPMKTVSVSTDSDPSLKSTCLDKTEANLADKFKMPDYSIMQAVTACPPVQSSYNIQLDKEGKPSMDIRMQKILETFKEDFKTTILTEKSNLLKIPTQISTKKQQQKEESESGNFKREEQNTFLVTKLLNTHRAFYNPPDPPVAPVNNLHLLPQPQSAQQEPPLPQFQTVACSCAMARELLLDPKKRLNLKPVPACALNIPRSPIQCPESTCQRMIFVSDFNKHLVVDHSHLPMERITPYQCKSFFLDARLAHCGTSKCHLLYLMRDKITNLGSSQYKDFLPILVMTTRISLDEMCGLRDQTSALEFFLIWVTGIASEEFPISVSLTVWSRSGRVPSCHVVYSGQMYSIRKSQRASDVWQSGRMLLLSAQQIETLTCHGKEMLNFQLSVH